MLKKFEVNIHKNTLFSKNDKLLVAFSGGVDSVVLTDLLYKAGYQFELAHCNFQLRENEADKDTEFCKNYADAIHSTIHIAYFNTKEYAEQHKLSIQMAARALRYNWFNELVEKHGFTYVLTAHHANDNVETLFVNLVRGTGIKGLQGIPEKQNHVIRPLLFATKENIRDYATKNNIAYREDSSNQEVKYKRNFIRHQIIPELKKLNPALEETFTTSIQFFKQSSEIVTQFANLKFKEICKEENNQLCIEINLLLQEPQKETLLFEWLHSKEFKTSQIQQLTEALLIEDRVGKQFSSASYQLVIDRKYIIVKAINKEQDVKEFVITSVSDIAHLPITLRMEETSDRAFSQNKNNITIAYSDNLFPLTLRKWKQGDKFKPFGMNGFKKLSDFFKDQKLSLFEKECVWILENKEHIIWVIGYRMDDRCKVNKETKKVIKIIVDKI
ncbi:MAG: tRNA lysidine(34) synthetase TilS [Bacteroidetes bacterium]|nr:tRNA lysidine(34) synthetase TilS [Bacteroidota bacterium]